MNNKYSILTGCIASLLTFTSFIPSVLAQSDDKNNHYNLSKIEEEKYIRRKLKNYVILRLGTIVGVSNGMRFHTAVNKFCYQSSLNQPLTIWKKFYKN